MKRNVKMAGLVTGVALAAVVGGALVAAQQTPELASASGDASPIGGSGAPVSTPSTGTPKPTATPSAPEPTPSSPVTSKPTAPPAGPLKIKLDLTKLSRGKAPNVPYAEGRTVHSGDLVFTMPASDGSISGVVQAGTGVLVLHHPSDGKSKLTGYSGDGARGESVADVNTVRSSADGITSAYDTQPESDTGIGPVTLHWRDNDTGKTRSLPLKGSAGAQVLAVEGSNVYFSSGSEGSEPALYRWTAGQPAPERIKGAPRPTAVSSDGLLAASLLSISDGGSCTALVDASSGARRWKTCDYQVDEVRTDRDYVVGGPAYRDGYADGEAAALEMRTGRLIREWNDLSFITTMMEDDEQMLMLVENDTSTAIVRCAPRTGTCELATPLKKGTGQEDGNRRPYALGH
jgi:hypothetical protein